MEGEEKKHGTSKQTLAFILPQRNRKEKKKQTGVLFLDANYFLYYLRPSLIKIQPWIFLLCYFTLFEFLCNIIRPTLNE